MIMLAEDKETLPISKALSKYVDIRLVASNTNFIPVLDDIIQSVMESNDQVAVFIDRVPNKYIEEIYQSVLDYAEIHYPYVLVFPVICMEYIAIHAIADSELEPKYGWLKIVRTCIDDYVVPKNKPPKIIGYKESFNTFENICKLYLNNHQDEVANIEGFGQIYDNLNKIAMLLNQLPIVDYKCGECRAGLFGKEVTDAVWWSRQVQMKSDWLQTKIRKIQLPDRWWEV